MEFDFQDPKLREKYPAHGVAASSEDVVLIWMPSIRMLLSHGSSNVLNPPVNAGMAGATQELLMRLVVATRELADMEDRIASFTDLMDGAEGSDAFLEVSEMYPIFLDYAFVSLKRFADYFSTTTLPLLFEKPGSAPGRHSFRKLRSAVIGDEVSVQAARPRVDMDALASVFAQSTGWFDAVADPDDVASDEEKGIRARIEHRVLQLHLIASSKPGKGPNLEVAYYQPGKDPVTANLVTLLHDSLDGMCHFLTEFQRVVGWGDEYDPFDCIAVPRYNNNVGRFWPTLR